MKNKAIIEIGGNMSTPLKNILKQVGLKPVKIKQEFKWEETDLKKKYSHLEEKAKKAINAAANIGAKIVMMVDGYITDEEALNLRDFLWYARDNGVTVELCPKLEKEEQK